MLTGCLGGVSWLYLSSKSHLGSFLKDLAVRIGIGVSSTAGCVVVSGIFVVVSDGVSVPSISKSVKLFSNHLLRYVFISLAEKVVQLNWKFDKRIIDANINELEKNTINSYH